MDCELSMGLCYFLELFDRILNNFLSTQLANMTLKCRIRWWENGYNNNVSEASSVG